MPSYSPEWSVGRLSAGCRWMRCFLVGQSCSAVCGQRVYTHKTAHNPNLEKHLFHMETTHAEGVPLSYSSLSTGGPSSNFPREDLGAPLGGTGTCEDTLRQVYEEMGADPNGQLSFESFFQVGFSAVATPTYSKYLHFQDVSF